MGRLARKSIRGAPHRRSPKLGISVPEDVRIAGFDDGDIARLMNPPLTTIRQPVKTLARISVASLMQRIRTPGLAPRTILLDTDLVVRST